MRIPRRVNTAWDWVEQHVSMVWVIATVAGVAATVRWIPALAAFILGAAVSGFVVRLRMAARVAALRAETDDLLRENGALRHEKTVLTSGVIAAQSVLTQRLPMIPEPPDAE